MFAAVVILILCSPVILGPLIIPTAKRRKTKKALKRLYGKEKLLPPGLRVERTSTSCDTQVDANLTKVDCGGRLQRVVESTDGPEPTLLATVCFVCGRFEKSAETSRALGSSFKDADSLPTLTRSIQDAKWNAKWRERSGRAAA